MKRLLLLLTVCMITAVSAYAQRTVSGVITDASGDPLFGANVVVKGTTVGAVTDFDGAYELVVPEGNNELVVSFTGYETQEITLGTSNVVDFTLSKGILLQEAVITALGISREKKTLGYAVEELDGAELEQQSITDVGKLLKGKMTGVDITQTSGVAGAGSNIVIRGYNSITGSNQPLFIVDGVPVGTDANGGGTGNGFLQGGQATASRFLDIDPNNIESVSVLKGLSATTLYGNRGRNGVILITTKTGSAANNVNNKTSITVSQSYYNTSIASLPDYQTNYGGGFHQNFGFFFSNWGPHFDRISTVDHPLSRLSSDDLRAQFPEYQDVPYEYKNYNSVENFFQDGHQATTSVGIKGGNENANFGATFSYADEVGFTPGNNLDRINLGLGGSVKLANNFTLNSSFNFVRTNFQTPPISYGSGSGLGTGTGLSVFADVFYTPRSVDLMNLPFETPIGSQSIYYRSGNDIQNPRWTAKYARNDDFVRRFFGQTNLKYDLTKNISLVYKLGMDTYNEEQAYVLNKGSVASDDYINGLYRTTNIGSTIWDHTILGQFNGRINEDIGFSGLAGWNFRQDIFKRDGLESQNQLVFGFERHSNFTSTSGVNSFNNRPIQYEEESQLLGLMGQISFDYRNFLYLNLSGRQDWSSTLEDGNNTLFYPSASVSFIPSTLWDMGPNVDFLKMRFGFGTSAGFPGAYTTRQGIFQVPRGNIDANGNPLSTHSNGSYFNDNGAGARLGNRDLKPELQKELEFGVEANLFKNRFGVDASVYTRATDDLITDQSLDPSTGYTSTVTNIGQIKTDGVELGLRARPIDAKVDWDLGLKFSKFSSKVTEMEGDMILIEGFSNLGNAAIKGESFGVMIGTARQTDENGNFIIDDDGYYTPTDETVIIGDPIPDFTSSLTNTLSMGNLSLNVELAYRQGGDIYSGTARALLARGLSKDTDFDRTQAFVLPGVTAEGEVNTKMITATNLYFNNYGFGPSSMNVYDGTTIRLREVSLSYSLPKRILDRTPFGGITLRLAGNNLWYKAINLPTHSNVDTDALGLGANSNGRGFEFLNGPSARQIGGSISIKF